MFINGRWYTETELAAYVISLKADNERVVEANKKISGMYWEQMNKNAELENKVKELEEKHWSECAMIAHYDDELKQAKELLKKVLIQGCATTEVEDFLNDKNKRTDITNDCKDCICYNCEKQKECCFREYGDENYCENEAFDNNECFGDKCDGFESKNNPKKKMTNADKIRSMSGVELAKFLHDTTEACAGCCSCEKCPIGLDGRSCNTDSINEWLEDEVNE